VRKSRKEKEAEAAEAKRKEEEESAARVYAEYLDAFEGEDTGRKPGSVFVPAGSRAAYNDHGPKRPPDGPSHNRNAMMRRVSAPVHDTRTLSQICSQSPSPPAGPKPKGKRAMDAFLEEIKK
jgi:U2-associated protein SR140